MNLGTQHFQRAGFRKGTQRYLRQTVSKEQAGNDADQAVIREAAKGTGIFKVDSAEQSALEAMRTQNRVI